LEVIMEKDPEETDDRKRAAVLHMTYEAFVERKEMLLGQAEELDEPKTATA